MKGLAIFRLKVAQVFRLKAITIFPGGIMQKFKCSQCKQFKNRVEFPERKKFINKKRYHADYICKKCHNDIQIIKIAKKNGLEYLQKKALRYQELATLYTNAAKKLEDKSNLSNELQKTEGKNSLLAKKDLTSKLN